MPLYRYKATRLDGKTVRGEMQAAGKAALKEQLQSQSMYLSACAEKQTETSSQRLGSRQLSEFCRELGAMLGAGVPLVRALNIMAKRDIPAHIKEVYFRLYRAIRQGSMLSQAMEAQGQVFPELLISMYRASEASGQMEQTSLRMAEHYEKSYRLKKKVSSAMTYPIILACVTLTVLLALFLVVLPKFFAMFENLNVALPGITQFMLNLSTGLRDHWLLLLIGALLAVLALRLCLRIPSVRLARDRARIRIPLVGKLLKIIYTARFARTLSSCYQSGISIIAALRNTRDTIGNDYIAAQFPALIADVRNGKSLSSAISRVDGFDSKLAASIQIGEETGKLYDMLANMADSFDYDADIALGKLVDILQPAMIILMAVIIGCVIVSVMLPMTTLYDAIGMNA